MNSKVMLTPDLITNMLNESFFSGNIENIKSLYSEEPKILRIKDTEDNTLVHLATKYNSIKIMNLLIEIEAEYYKKNKHSLINFDLRNKSGITPIQIAIACNYNDVFDILCRLGVNLSTGVNENSMFQLAKSANNRHVMRYLILNGYPINEPKKPHTVH